MEALIQAATDSSGKALAANTCGLLPSQLDPFHSYENVVTDFNRSCVWRAKAILLQGHPTRALFRVEGDADTSLIDMGSCSQGYCLSVSRSWIGPIMPICQASTSNPSSGPVLQPPGWCPPCLRACSGAPPRQTRVHLGNRVPLALQTCRCSQSKGFFCYVYTQQLHPLLESRHLAISLCEPDMGHMGLQTTPHAACRVLACIGPRAQSCRLCHTHHATRHRRLHRVSNHV